MMQCRKMTGRKERKEDLIVEIRRQARKGEGKNRIENGECGKTVVRNSSLLN